MGRDTIQLENAVSTISQEYLLEFTSEYGIPEGLHPELPGLEDTIVDFPEGDLSLCEDRASTSYVRANYRISSGDIYAHSRPVLHHNERISSESDVWCARRQRHARPLLGGSWSTRTMTVSVAVEWQSHSAMREVSFSSGGGTQDGLTHEEPPEETAMTTEVAEEAVLGEEMASVEPVVNKRRKQLRCKRGNEEVEVNAPPKVLRKDQAYGPTQSTTGGKSLASIGLEAGIPIPTPTPQDIPADVSDPDPLSYSKPQSVSEQDIAESSKGASVAGDPESEKSSSFTSIIGSPGGIYQPGWGVTNSCRLDTSDACQDVVDHIVPPEYFSELRHLPNDDFISLYNMNLARQMAMGSQLRLRLDAEVKSLKVVETEVHGLRNQAQNLKTLLEAEVDMKKATEARNADLAKEVESLCAKFADLQVNNSQLSQQVSTLQAQVTGEEKIKAAFEEFKRLEDEKVEQRCAEMDARLDALSIDFDEELYPHMLTAIAGRRWVIGHGLRLAVMKCAESTDLRQAFADVVSAGIVKGMSEGLKYGVEHGGAKLDLAALEAYDPEAEGKYIAALTALRDMKYPLVDQLEQLKDAPIDLLMASLHLESDTGEDAPPFIRDLRPSSSQLQEHVVSEVRDHKKPWAFKEEDARRDAVAAEYKSVIEEKEVSDCLQILLEDAATQTELSEDEASPKLIRSKSLPSMYNLNWP
ncbi:hypothetical protein Tco_1401799 [Tanacetum coccineum]